MTYKDTMEEDKTKKKKKRTPLPKSKYKFVPSRTKTIYYTKEHVDETTGEVSNMLMSYEYGADPFIKLYNPMFLTHLSKTGVATFCLIIKHLCYGNVFMFDAKKLSETVEALTIKMDSKKIYRGVKELEKCNFMYKEGYQRYRINPNFIQRGRIAPD